MRRSREKKLDAYFDRGLSERERARIERSLASDPNSQCHLRERAALSAAIRTAWTEGPPSPSPRRLMAAIGPELRRIDVERAERMTLGERFTSWLQLGPAALATAAAMALMLVTPGSFEVAFESGRPLNGAETGAPGDLDPTFVGSIESPSAIYDLAQGDTPLMVFEAPDGSTVIWLLEDQAPDEISRRQLRGPGDEERELA